MLTPEQKDAIINSRGEKDEEESLYSSKITHEGVSYDSPSIKQFKDEYRWLSNFEPFESPLMLNDIVYKTNEHFYQAMKAQSIEDARMISELSSAGEAKKAGSKIKLREDWLNVKDNVMEYGLNFKFSFNKTKQRLIDTYPLYIQEGNWWNDTYWGVCLKTDQGQNKLGNMIMTIRKRIMIERGLLDDSAPLYIEEKKEEETLTPTGRCFTIKFKSGKTATFLDPNGISFDDAWRFNGSKFGVENIEDIVKIA